MTENEYIIVTNVAKIRAAKGLVRDCPHGDEYGISHVAYLRLMSQLEEIAASLERKTPELEEPHDHC